jgi:hypothetical protein
MLRVSCRCSTGRRSGLTRVIGGRTLLLDRPIGPGLTSTTGFRVVLLTVMTLPFIPARLQISRLVPWL